jgi:hypothetical protein
MRNKTRKTILETRKNITEEKLVQLVESAIKIMYSVDDPSF